MFPLEASEEVLKKWPPTIVISSEFDNYEAGMQMFSPRLKKVGHLLEFVSYPGTIHGFMVNLNSRPLIKKYQLQFIFI